jgi:hypothetical protein
MTFRKKTAPPDAAISRKTLGIKATQGTKTTKSNDKRIAKADAIPMLGKLDLIAEIICVILAKNATDPTTTEARKPKATRLILVNFRCFPATVIGAAFSKS